MAEPLTFRPLEPTEVFEPQLELNDSEAQSLMDQLWQCGIRPTEGTGSAGAMAATQAHLADLRRLIFKDARQSALSPKWQECEADELRAAFRPLDQPSPAIGDAFKHVDQIGL